MEVAELVDRLGNGFRKASAQIRRYVKQHPDFRYSEIVSDDAALEKAKTFILPESNEQVAKVVVRV